MSRASMSCGTIPSSLYVCNWSPQRREKGTGKKIWRKNSYKFFKFNEKNKAQGSKSFINPKHKNHQRTHNKLHHKKLLKTNNEEKILKAAREKWDTLYYRETKIRITTDFSLETIQAREDWSKALKALWVDTKKIFQKLAQNKDFSSYAKVKKNSSPSRHEL